jgi:hypothetical protein
MDQLLTAESKLLRSRAVEENARTSPQVPGAASAYAVAILARLADFLKARRRQDTRVRT